MVQGFELGSVVQGLELGFSFAVHVMQARSR